MVDPASGQLLHAQEMDADRLRLTPDGAFLVLDGWDEGGRWVEVRHAGDLQPITRLEGPEVTSVPLLDGDFALMAAFPNQQLMISLMQAPLFKCAPFWSADTPISWIGGQ